MSLQRYDDYKDSGREWLGSVPSHWSIKRLRFVAELNPSKSELAGISRKTEVSFLPMEAIGEDGSISLGRIRPIAEVETGYTYFRNGDIAIAKITPCFENGKGALMQSLEAGIGFGTTELIVVRPKPSEVVGPFLNWIFCSPNFRAQGEGSMYGAGGQKRVPDEFVRNFTWAFPSLDEQTEIAAFLDRETAKIDLAIFEQEKLIALLAEKRQACISHAVTRGLNPNVPIKESGVAWLGEVPMHWNVQSLKHIVSTPITDGPHETPNFPDYGVPFISAEAVSGGFIDFDKKRGYISAEDHKRYSIKYQPQMHDIYMVKSGATTGVTAIVETEKEFNIWSPLAAIRCDKKKADPYFVLAALRSRNFQEGVALNWSFGTQQNIGMGVLGDLPIALPPLSEQKEIAAFLTLEIPKLNALGSEAERAIALLKERRSALIAAAVGGQIDVRGLHK